MSDLPRPKGPLTHWHEEEPSGLGTVDIRDAIRMISTLTVLVPAPTSQAEVDQRTPRFIQALELCGISVKPGNLIYVHPGSIKIDGWIFGFGAPSEAPNAEDLS